MVATGLTVFGQAVSLSPLTDDVDHGDPHATISDLFSEEPDSLR